MRRRRRLIGVILLVVCSCAWAHNPIVVNGGATDTTTAYPVKDISVSRVAYHHVKTGQAVLWLTFTGKAGQVLAFQMGVPRIDRYAGVRPATAILGPGLPGPPVLPFAVPEGMGAVIVTTEGQEPNLFHEEFTGTVDWQFREESLSLPQDGTYYMAVYLPSGGEGKLWVALGKTEAFGLWDLIRMPVTIVDVRCFHEVFPWGGILGWAYTGIIGLLIGGIGALVVL